MSISKTRENQRAPTPAGAKRGDPLEVETARTAVYPWLCDMMGHLATQHYMRIFDDATLQLLGHFSGSINLQRKNGRGWADVRHEISYRRELVSGDLLVVRSAVLGFGRTSLTYRHRLLCALSATEHAVLAGVCVYFDLRKRRALPVPARLLARSPWVSAAASRQ